MTGCTEKRRTELEPMVRPYSRRWLRRLMNRNLNAMIAVTRRQKAVFVTPQKWAVRLSAGSAGRARKAHDGELRV
jgi:hypothetical protein